MLLKEPFLSKEGIYNLRNKTTHRPAEYFEMMEIRELLQYNTNELEYQVWSDLSARCTYIAYNTVKQISILEGNIKNYANSRDTYLAKYKNAKKQVFQWAMIASVACIVCGALTIHIIFH